MISQPMAMCADCPDIPLVMTKEWAGYDFVCMECQRLYTFMEPRPTPTSTELRARQSAFRIRYELERGARERQALS